MAQRIKLKRGSRPVKWRQLTVIERATAPLSREFDLHSYYWEVLELIRRLLISGVLLAFPSYIFRMTRLVFVQGCVCHLTVGRRVGWRWPQTSFLYLILLFMVRPFKRVDDTIVAAATNVLLVFVFLTSILVKVFDDIIDHRRG